MGNHGFFPGYHYVEFASRRMPNFRNLIIDIRDAKKYAEKFGRYDAYTSMYFYPEKVAKYVKGNLRDGKPSISGYNGRIISNYLFFDIDGKRLEDAHKVAKALASFFYDNGSLTKMQ